MCSSDLAIHAGIPTDVDAGNRHFRTHPAGVEARFGERDRQTTVRAVVRGMQQPLVGELDQQILQSALGRKIDRWRLTADEIMYDLELFASAQLAATLTEQDDRIT